MTAFPITECWWCGDARQRWTTCSEGACELTEPCDECNADGAAPTDWDKVRPGNPLEDWKP